MKTSHIDTFHNAGRREALAALSGLGASMLLGGALTTRPAAAQSPLNCVLTPDLTEGPYFVDEKLGRSDIRTDPATGVMRPGVLLTLTFNVYQVGSSCGPLAGAYVDIWHADAGGSYSDESAMRTSGQKFLRGYQITDSNGSVKFTTIYPGWYMGRAVHIHFKIRTYSGTQTLGTFTSQFFFDDSVTDTVYQQAPYSSRPNRDTRNSNDGIYSGAGSNVSRVLMIPSPTGDGYGGTLNVGVNLTSDPVALTTPMVLPQIAYGGGWQTSLFLANNNENASSAQVSFISENGQALSVPLSGLGSVSSQVAPLPARSITVLDLANSAGLTQGWAEVALPPGVTGYGLYRWAISGSVQEALVPLSSESNSAGLFVFDDTLGLTAYAFANPSTQATTLTVLAFAADGSSLGSGTLPVEARSRVVGFFRNIPGLSGMNTARGIVRLSSSNGVLCGSALRFGVSNFASTPIVYL